jgi:biopolymer transport protein ExbB
MDAIIEQLTTLWQQALEIWISGGWAMIAIAVTAFVMFALGMNVYFKLCGKGFTSVSEKTWRHWINHPDQRRGYVGELLDFVTGGNSLKDTATFFEELRATEIAPFERDLLVMKICVSVAPLLGLLGTVTGMLATFGALASGAGGEKTMGLVAKGISEALVTTETGLVIALPGLFFQYQLVRKHERYKAFLAGLETVCTQKQYKKLHEQKAASNIFAVKPVFEPDEISLPQGVDELPVFAE